MYDVLMLLWFLSAASATAEQNLDKIATWISPPCIIEEIHGIRVYEEEMPIFFPIADIADPPKFPETPCGAKLGLNDTFWCRNLQGISKINKGTYEQLSTMNKMFTLKGVNFEAIKSQDKTDFLTHDSPPLFDIEAVQDFHNSWYAALEDRKYSNETLTRNPRSLPLVAAAKIIGNNFPTLFVGLRKILPGLNSMFKHLPPILMPFLNPPNGKSVFSIIRKSSAKITEENVKNYHDYSGKFYSDDFQTRLPTYLAANSDVIHMQSSLINFNTIMVTSQAITLQSCRNGQIPPLVVPPSLLSGRLLEQDAILKANKSSDLQFVISPSEFMLFYSIKNAAECVFDDDGGVVAVKTYLKRRSANYKIYQFKSYAFQFEDSTCELAIPSAYIIMETKSRALYTVSDVDQDTCSPRTNPLCRLPQVFIPYGICTECTTKIQYN